MEKKEITDSLSEDIVDNNQVIDDAQTTAETSDEKDVKSTPSGRNSIGLIIAILLSIAALASSGYLYQLHTKQVQQTSASADALKGSLQSLRTEATGNQQRLQKRLERQYAELQTLKDSIKQLYSREESPQQKWSVAEVEHLLQLAIDQLLLAANLDGALAALSIADRRIASNGDPSLQPVREQIARDIASLQQVERIDLAGTIHRLRAIEESIDQLPAGSQTRMSNDSSSKEKAAGAASVWEQIGQDLSGLVRIRRIEHPEVPLLPVEQQFFLRENTAALLMSARLALLRNDAQTYRSNLQQAQEWLYKYFNPENPATKWAIAELNKLSAINPEPILPDISGSLVRLQTISKGWQK